ncbi:MAG: hypothetical protein JWL77_3346 [Chthonomonadaceae bacterium]|nr:hypothetical protein [Chthonomonadaceae bacterium]
MMRTLSFLGLAALILMLTACNQTSTPGNAPGGTSGSVTGNAPAGAAPVAITTKSGVAMVYVQAGSFTMGSDQGAPEEAPPHKVSVPAFLMDQVPVTNAMFEKAQLPNPSHWQDSPKQPVERVRWRDAKQYCNERSRLEGLKPYYNEKTPEWDCDYAANGYRLPTEAEWEYAARGTCDSPYDFGAKDALRQYAWFAENSDAKTHPVGEKRPNSRGLHDMYGNVSVWCEDVYDPQYYAISPSDDPHGPASPGKDVKRVLRGGNWKVSADLCRATHRQGERTGDTDACFSTDYCGMRCVRRVTPEELAQLKIAKTSG